MADRLDTIELILSKCLDTQEHFESSEIMSPELLGLGEKLAKNIEDAMGIAASEAGHLEQELGEKGSSSQSLPRFKDYLLDLQSAASCLVVHIKIVRILLEWTQDEEKLKSVDEGLALFSRALDEVKALVPPDSISELRKIHESILKNLESYVQLYKKIKEGKDKGDVEMLEEASSDLAKIETGQILEPVEMFSLEEEIKKAQDMLGDLKQEVSGLLQ